MWADLTVASLEEWPVSRHYFPRLRRTIKALAGSRQQLHMVIF
jgi:hypothetical protein